MTSEELRKLAFDNRDVLTAVDASLLYAFADTIDSQAEELREARRLLWEARNQLRLGNTAGRDIQADCIDDFLARTSRFDETGASE